jgi:hypothetical protein
VTLSRPPPPAELRFSDPLTSVPTLHHPETSALFVYQTAGNSRPPRTPETPGTARATGPLEPQALRDRLRPRLAILLHQVRRRLRDAGMRYKRYADRRAVPYNPDDLVGKRVALRRDVRLNKLEPHGLGVYQVVAAGDHTVPIATLKGPVQISKNIILQALSRDRPIDRRLDMIAQPPAGIQSPDHGLRKLSATTLMVHFSATPPTSLGCLPQRYSPTPMARRLYKS